MRICCSAMVVITLLLAGCSASRGDREEARQQLERARSLEAAGNLSDAAREYALTAERYPRYEWYPVAVRKAAILYASLPNPGRDDSVAVFWFRTLLGLDIPDAEKELVNLEIVTLERAQELSWRLRSQRESADSLHAVLKHLFSTVGVQSRQIEDLEEQVKKVAEELRQLKEIDVRLSKRKHGE
jgi:hypothetical protein